MSNAALTAMVVLLWIVTLTALVVALRARPVKVRGDVPADVEGLRSAVQALQNRSERGVRNVGVVRYDAFGDMGGRLSWSMAFLDDAGAGVVLTSIHGRTEARTYAKNVTKWHGDQELSPEEEDAVKVAKTPRRNKAAA